MRSIPGVSLDEAWTIMRDTEDAVLIDVRTTEEWRDIGRPDLASLGKEARFIEWVNAKGASNPSFLDDAVAGLEPAQPILLICRSGVRSMAAAEALAAAGFTDTYNVGDGFEGDMDSAGQRPGGWKGSGLPWSQK